MNRLMKAIFRLDFKASYQLMNRPGDVLKILLEAQDDYWTQFRERREAHGLQAVHEEKDRSLWTNIAVEHATVHGSIEVAIGVPLETARNHQFFSIANKVVTQTLETFDIRHVDRAGLRFFVFVYGASRKMPSDVAFFSRSHLRDFGAELGEISDISCTVEGITADAVGYRLTTGPAGPNDRKNILKIVDVEGDSASPDLIHSYTLDLDLFERDLEIPGSSFDRWSKTKWSAIDDFVRHLGKSIY